MVRSALFCEQNRTQGNKISLVFSTMWLPHGNTSKNHSVWVSPWITENSLRKTFYSYVFNLECPKIWRQKKKSGTPAHNEKLKDIPLWYRNPQHFQSACHINPPRQKAMTLEGYFRPKLDTGNDINLILQTAFDIFLIAVVGLWHSDLPSDFATVNAVFVQRFGRRFHFL